MGFLKASLSLLSLSLTHAGNLDVVSSRLNQVIDTQSCCPNDACCPNAAAVSDPFSVSVDAPSDTDVNLDLGGTGADSGKEQPDQGPECDTCAQARLDQEERDRRWLQAARARWRSRHQARANARLELANARLEATLRIEGVLGALGMQTGAHGAQTVRTPVAAIPSSDPNQRPSPIPSRAPSNVPTRNPTRQPSSTPSRSPSNIPTSNPTRQPSPAPSESPTRLPSPIPSRAPSNVPTRNPTQQPSPTPSQSPKVLCIPGRVERCPCSVGTGHQRCSTGGRSYGPCTCASPAPHKPGAPGLHPPAGHGPKVVFMDSPAHDGSYYSSPATYHLDDEPFFDAF